MYRIRSGVSDDQIPVRVSGEAMAHSRAQFVSMPYVRIVQQPASNALRFRYRSEVCSGSITGASSMRRNRTYPSIMIFGPATTVCIVVSCVTKDKPYRPHPHKLVGRNCGDRGVFSVRTEITEGNNEYIFQELRMQCVTRQDVGESLKTREQLRVDPFRTGFSHRFSLRSRDMKAVRLAFQVFLERPDGKIYHALTPVVSDVIYDKKSITDLTIKHASLCSSPACGGTKLILLCEKVTRGDVQAVFFQKGTRWQEIVTKITVHKSSAIVFKTPPYWDQNISNTVKVQYQLRRLSDNVESPSQTFEYFPNKQAIPSPGIDYINNKIKKPLLPSLFQFGHAQQNKCGSCLNAAQDNWTTNTQGNLAVPGPSNHNPFQELSHTGHELGTQYNLNLPPMQPAAYKMNSLPFHHHHQPLSPSIEMYPNASATTNSMQDAASSKDSIHGVPSDMAISMQYVGSAIATSILGGETATGQVIQSSTTNWVQENDYTQEMGAEDAAVAAVAADVADAAVAAVTSSAEQLATELLAKCEMTPQELLEILSNMISSDFNRLSVKDS